MPIMSLGIVLSGVIMSISLKLSIILVSYTAPPIYTAMITSASLPVLLRPISTTKKTTRLGSVLIPAQLFPITMLTMTRTVVFSGVPLVFMLIPLEEFVFLL